MAVGFLKKYSCRKCPYLAGLILLIEQNNERKEVLPQTDLDSSTGSAT